MNEHICFFLFNNILLVCKYQSQTAVFHASHTDPSPVLYIKYALYIIYTIYISVAKYAYYKGISHK